MKKYHIILIMFLLGIVISDAVHAQSQPAQSAGKLIKTPLPIVYKKDGSNALEVLPGLDLSRKDEIWGFRSGCGIFIQRKTDGVSGMEQPDVKKFAESFTFNGKRGKLPSKDFVVNNWSSEEKKALDDTWLILYRRDIRADDSETNFWCLEDCKPNYAFVFHMGRSRVNCDPKTQRTAGGRRVAIVFP